MLKDILAISGQGGLFKMISQTKNSIIVESIVDGKRIPAYSTSRISALEDISIYTEDGDVKLKEVFKRIHGKENGGKAIDNKLPNQQLQAYFNEVLPEYDKDRVYVSDIKKVLNWYNLLHDKNLLKIEEDDSTEVNNQE